MAGGGGSLQLRPLSLSNVFPTCYLNDSRLNVSLLRPLALGSRAGRSHSQQRRRALVLRRHISPKPENFAEVAAQPPPASVAGKFVPSVAGPMIPGPRLRQRSAGGEGARAERPAPPAPAAAGGGSAASRRARDKSRWPLLPGCWSDDPDADRKAWMACSFDRVLNA